MELPSGVMGEELIQSSRATLPANGHEMRREWTNSSTNDLNWIEKIRGEKRREEKSEVEEELVSMFEEEIGGTTAIGDRWVAEKSRWIAKEDFRCHSNASEEQSKDQRRLISRKRRRSEERRSNCINWENSSLIWRGNSKRRRTNVSSVASKEWRVRENRRTHGKDVQSDCSTTANSLRQTKRKKRFDGQALRLRCLSPKIERRRNDSIGMDQSTSIWIKQVHRQEEKGQKGKNDGCDEQKEKDEDEDKGDSIVRREKCVTKKFESIGFVDLNEKRFSVEALLRSQPHPHLENELEQKICRRSSRRRKFWHWWREDRRKNVIGVTRRNRTTIEIDIDVETIVTSRAKLRTKFA